MEDYRVNFDRRYLILQKVMYYNRNNKLKIHMDKKETQA